MKLFRRVIVLLMLIPVLTSAAVSSDSGSDKYDIVRFYELVDVDSGAKAMDTYGSLHEIKSLYLPTKIDEGRYTVKVTREDSNFYRICDTDLFIETRYCYEYAAREEVLLNLTSNYGYTRGEIIFF